MIFRKLSDVKKRILITILAGFIIVAIAIFTNYLSSYHKSEALGQCEFKSLAITAKLPNSPDDPLNSERNQRYYDSSAELIMACMKEHGYVQKQPETNNFLLHYKDPSMQAYASYEASTLEDLWVRQ